MKTSKKSNYDYSAQLEETGEPFAGMIAIPYHIRTQGFPIPIGFQSGIMPTHRFTLQSREKDVISQPIDVPHKTQLQAIAFYSNQNEWLKDRLGEIVPGTMPANFA